MSNFERTMTTSSSVASDALSTGIDAFNRWRADAIGHIDRALEADPQFALGHAIKGIAMIGGRNERFRPVVDACVAGAMENRQGISETEQAWVDTLNLMATGNLEEAVMNLELLLDRDPTDLHAHRTIQQELFWGGEADWMRDVAKRARPHWTGDEADFSTFLSVYAFSMEEAGEHVRAESAAREAIERDPNDPWGAHAVAHVLEMQGRYSEGIEWLEALSGNWGEINQIAHHLWWHLCLFCLEDGQHDRILELLDTQVRNIESPMVQAVPDAYIDIQNVASMLMRLSLRGVDIGDRWHSIAEVCAQRANNHSSPFTSAHAVMALAGAGEFNKAEEVLGTMEDCALINQGAIGLRMRSAAVPAARGALAWFLGEPARAISELMPARRNLWRMGGSHAQRDVFTQILYAAATGQGRSDIANIVINDLQSTGFTSPQTRTLYAGAA